MGKPGPGPVGRSSAPAPPASLAQTLEETDGRREQRQEAGHTPGRELSLRSKLAIADS